MEDVNVTKETTPETDIRALNETIERESAFVQLLLGEVNKNIVGQRIMLERLGFEGGVVMPDNKTVYMFEDGTPGSVVCKHLPMKVILLHSGYCRS